METVYTGAGVVVAQVLTCPIVETGLILTVINISFALFASVPRLTGAQEIADEVGTCGIVGAGVGITFVDFWNK